MKTEIDSGNKLKILSKENQDEVTRLNESREISKVMIVTEKNRFICSTKTISCLKEDIKELETPKDVLVKQLLQQRHENIELPVKLKKSIVTPTEKVQSKEKTYTQKPNKEIDNKQISVGTRLSDFWEKDKKFYPCKVDSINNKNEAALSYDDGTKENDIDLKKKLTRYVHAIVMVENIFLEREKELIEKLVRKENLYLIKIQMNLILIMLMTNVQQQPKEEN